MTGSGGVAERPAVRTASQAGSVRPAAVRSGRESSANRRRALDRRCAAAASCRAEQHFNRPATS